MQKEILQTEWSDTRIGRALIRELTTGFQLEKALENERVKSAAQDADKMREASKKMKHMKHVFEMPQRDHFRLVQKYGQQEVHSKEFMRYLQKKMPHLATSKV